jgi:hypothetical protein
MPVTSDLAANLIESAKSPQCNSFSAWVKSPWDEFHAEMNALEKAA